MLNRVYIVLGVLAIIVLAGAFIVPRFIQWGDYRDRMQVLASGVLGTPVTIRGDIAFSLLPQPKLHFSDVVVGPPEDPAATVATVDAEFSLMDFLRDNYKVTKLVLEQPVVDLKLDDSGLLASGFNITEDAQSATHLALGQANIVDGSVRLADARSGETFTVSGVGGEMKLADISGPFQFQGNASYDGGKYAVRFNTSAMDGDGSNRLTLAVQNDTGMAVTAEGQLTPGIAPRFDGAMSYRQKPPVTTVADDIRGDLVFESKFTASTDRVVMSGYTLQPDENRAGMRLTGAASIQLGKARSFDAVISGGVFSLPPRDAKEDATQEPYELTRLLSELPPALQPSLPGRIGVDLAEVGLRGFSLRNVRMDAHTDGQAWQIDDFKAKLPGDTNVGVTGTLAQVEGRPTFEGKLSLATERLDALGALWRKPAEDNPLLNLPASYEAKMLLAGDALGLSDGVLTLNGVPHSFGLRVGFGAEPRLDIIGKFNSLSASDSAALAALAPDVSSNASFGLSFPNGSFALNGAGGTILGLDGKDMVAEGQWSQSGITFTRLAAADFGGLALDTAMTATGTLTAPALWGKGTVGVSSSGAPALKLLLDYLAVRPEVRQVIGLSVPANMSFELAQPGADKSQMLTLRGRADTAAADLTLTLGGGVFAVPGSHLTLAGTLESSTPDALSQQIGFGGAHVFPPDGDMFVSVNVEGAVADGFSARFNASVGEERIGFVGNLIVATTGEMQGTGALDGYLSDGSGLAQLIGATGISLPALSAKSTLHFEGTRLAQLNGINGKSGEHGFSGDLTLTRTGDAGVVAGDLAFDTVDLPSLATVMAGPAALLPVAGQVWPDGPIAMGQVPRPTRGSVSVSVADVANGGTQSLRGATFDFSWTDTETRLSHFRADLAQGQVDGDIVVCCSDALTSKTVSGHLTLAKVKTADVFPSELNDALSGTVDGGVQFQGTGESLMAILGNLTGEGNFTAADLVIKRFDPKVFPTVAKLDNLLEMEPDALSTLMGIALQGGDFTAAKAAGAFTIAGGILRLANLSIDGNGGRLAGDINVALATTGLTGSVALTPLNFTDANGLISAETSQIVSQSGGTLSAPKPVLDLDPMVAAVQTRANEIEVARLEALRAEDLARQQAAAAERNRLIAEQRQRDADAAAAKAAAAAEKQRLEDLQNPPVVTPAPTTPATPAPAAGSDVPAGGLNLNYVPNQPTPATSGVNQAF